MTALRRALIGLAVAVLGLMNFAPSATAHLDEGWSACFTYTYDGHHHTAERSDTASERGPPTTHMNLGAVDHRPNGASARLQLSSAWTYTTSDDSVRLVQSDSGSGTTRTALGGRVADMRVVPGVRCAANTGRTAARACSFAGATTVLMADGTRKAIEDVKVGDKVIATDPETGEQVAKRVEHVFVHEDTVIDMVVGGEVITTTENHPFWSVTDQRFERADELSPGEKVLGADGRVITVSGLHLDTARDAMAYNLSVQGIHTYHVGNAGILVHNTCPIHGNSLDSPKLTTLYRLDDADGNLLKWGITSRAKPERRYTIGYLADKDLVPITTGSRREMARIERWMVEYHRGPLNREPWAGGGW